MTSHSLETVAELSENISKLDRWMKNEGIDTRILGLFAHDLIRQVKSRDGPLIEGDFRGAMGRSVLNLGHYDYVSVIDGTIFADFVLEIAEDVGPKRFYDEICEFYYLCSEY